jgi:hypothetical protein
MDCEDTKFYTQSDDGRHTVTLIEIRPYRWGWKVFEAPGVEPVFPGKDHAIDYASAARTKKLLFHAKLVSFAASIRNGCRESGGLPTGIGDNHGGLAENWILSRCAGVNKLPNKISGRRPLFLM